MAKYKIVLMVDGSNINSVSKKVKETFGQDATSQIEKYNSPTSRADRLSEAESFVEDAKGIVEELKSELEEWKDGLPENLQNGSKAEELDEAISALDELQQNLESADFSGVSFPGMY